MLDLSEHIEKRLQDHIREVEKYRYAPGFIALTQGPEHRFTFANKAYEKLIGRANLIGQRAVDVMPEIAEQGIVSLLDEVYRTGERLIAKKAAIRLNRGIKGEPEIRHLDFIYEPVRGADGEVSGLFCEGSDITEIHVASERLNDIQNELMHVARINAMGTMAATLSHELNQPLAVIANYAAGCATMLEEGEIPVKAVQIALSEMSNASLRAGAIIKSLRHMTKRSAPTFETFNLSEAFEESVHLVQVGGCQEVAIMSRCAPSIKVFGNKIQVQQVIINLLRNACQAASITERQSEVRASAEMKNGSPCVIISDNGSGFPERMKGNVFHWCESAKDDGMGIGLSISRTIAESHGGSIAVNETGPEGTTVSFTLPKLAAN